MKAPRPAALPGQRSFGASGRPITFSLKHLSNSPFDLFRNRGYSLCGEILKNLSKRLRDTHLSAWFVSVAGSPGSLFACHGGSMAGHQEILKGHLFMLWLHDVATGIVQSRSKAGKFLPSTGVDRWMPPFVLSPQSQRNEQGFLVWSARLGRSGMARSVRPRSGAVLPVWSGCAAMDWGDKAGCGKASRRRRFQARKARQG